MRAYNPGYIVDAEPGPDFYYGVVRLGWTRDSLSCLHRHQTRKAAERCARRMVQAMRNPR
jgi:hypothetical protein